MHRSEPGIRRRRGYTLIEVMIVVLVIGLLATVALPLFQRYQLRAKSAEVRTNLAALHVVEESYFSENGVYVSAAPEPPAIPGSQPAAFNFAGSDFVALGWRPESRVYFSYGVATNGNQSAYTADGGADLDGNGVVQFWGYAKPQAGGGLVPARVGCDVTGLVPEQIGPCTPDSGTSTF